VSQWVVKRSVAKSVRDQSGRVINNSSEKSRKTGRQNKEEKAKGLSLESDRNLTPGVQERRTTVSKDSGRGQNDHCKEKKRN